MYEALKLVLKVQEKDVKMIRLMQLKRERQKELDNLHAIKRDFEEQLVEKEQELMELKKSIKLGEMEVKEADEKVKRLESQQNEVKKVDEFNALSREIAAAERERAGREQRLSDLIDNQVSEEELLEQLKETMAATEENSREFEEEIKESIRGINAEGRGLKEERDVLVTSVDPEILGIYEKLLKNKRDRVLVPIENRTCSGCHIVLTAQHENVVRKGERLVFCEHCSRILYWPEAEEILEGTETKKRRRRVKTV